MTGPNHWQCQWMNSSLLRHVLARNAGETFAIPTGSVSLAKTLVSWRVHNVSNEERSVWKQSGSVTQRRSTEPLKVVFSGIAAGPAKPLLRKSARMV